MFFWGGLWRPTKWRIWAPTFHCFFPIFRLNGPVPSLEEPSSASKTLREERESQKRRCAEWEKPKLPELKAGARNGLGMSVFKNPGVGWPLEGFL